MQPIGGWAYTTESLTHGQCDARPTAIFPATEHHRPSASSTKLYCLVTEAHVCEQLAQSRYMKVKQPGVEKNHYLLVARPLHNAPHRVIGLFKFALIRHWAFVRKATVKFYTSVQSRKDKHPCWKIVSRPRLMYCVAGSHVWFSDKSQLMRWSTVVHEVPGELHQQAVHYSLSNESVRIYWSRQLVSEWVKFNSPLNTW